MKVQLEKESDHFLLRDAPLGSPIRRQDFKMCPGGTQILPPSVYD